MNKCHRCSKPLNVQKPYDSEPVICVVCGCVHSIVFEQLHEQGEWYLHSHDYGEYSLIIEDTE